MHPDAPRGAPSTGGSDIEKRWQWTRCLVIAATAVAASAAVPAPACADTVFTPFIGRSFATRADSEKVTTIGASLASTVAGGFGFELDFGRTSEAVGSAAFTDNSRVTMLMGNAVVGFPFGRFRPYVVGGMGWLRKEVLSDGAAARSGGLGLDAGGGFLGFLSGSLGLRVDLRYVRNVTMNDLDSLHLPAGFGLADYLVEDLSFWRLSTGLAIRF